MIQDTVDVGPGLPPTPAPAPVSPAPRPVPPPPTVARPAGGAARWLPWLGMAVLGGALAFSHRGSVVPAPAPSALGLAVADHYRHGPAGIVAISARVRSGELKTAKDVVSAFAAEAKPAAEALAATVKPRCDADGNVTDAAGLAEDLKRAGAYAGGAK